MRASVILVGIQHSTASFSENVQMVTEPEEEEVLSFCDQETIRRSFIILRSEDGLTSCNKNLYVK